MRVAVLLLLASLSLAACALSETEQPVDVANLPPMSGQERALLIAADAAAASGDVATAERNYLTAAAKSQGHVDAHLSLANLYMRGKQPENARDILTRAAKFQPDHAEINRLLGKLAVGEGQAQAALSYFTRGLKTAPSNMDLLVGAGIANDMLRQHSAAQNYYESAMKLHAKEDLSMVRTNLGMSYILSNEPKKAIEVLKRDARKKNASAVIRHNLALAYGILGRHADARQVLQGDLTEDQRLQSLQNIQAMITKDNEAAAPTPLAATVHQP